MLVVSRELLTFHHCHIKLQKYSIRLEELFYLIFLTKFVFNLFLYVIYEFQAIN